MDYPPRPLVCDRCVELIGYSMGECVEPRVYCQPCGERVAKEYQERRTQAKVTQILEDLGVEPLKIAEVLRAFRS